MYLWVLLVSIIGYVYERKLINPRFSKIDGKGKRELLYTCYDCNRFDIISWDIDVHNIEIVYFKHSKQCVKSK